MLADTWPPDVRATSSVRRDPGRGDRAGWVPGAARANDYTRPAAVALNRPDHPADVANVNSTIAARPTRIDGNRGGLGAPIHQPGQLAEQPEPRPPPRAACRRAGSARPRYRPLSSIGTDCQAECDGGCTVRQRRTTVAAGAACG